MVTETHITTASLPSTGRGSRCVVGNAYHNFPVSMATIFGRKHCVTWLPTVRKSEGQKLGRGTVGASVGDERVECDVVGVSVTEPGAGSLSAGRGPPESKDSMTSDSFLSAAQIALWLWVKKSVCLRRVCDLILAMKDQGLSVCAARFARRSACFSGVPSAFCRGLSSKTKANAACSAMLKSVGQCHKQMSQDGGNHGSWDELGHSVLSEPVVAVDPSSS